MKNILLMVVGCLILTPSTVLCETNTNTEMEFMAYTGKKKINFPQRVNKLDAKAIGLMGQKKFEEAIEVFDRSLKIMPKNPRALGNRGNCYLGLDQTDKALSDFRKTLSMAPEFRPVLSKPMSQAYLKRGRKSIDAGQPQEALKDFESAVKWNPRNAAAFSEMSFMAQQSRQYDACVSYTNKAIHADPAFSDGYGNRAACLASMGKGDQAVSDLGTAIKLQPNYAPFYASRAGILYNLGRQSDALIDAKRAVALDPAFNSQLAPIFQGGH